MNNDNPAKGARPTLRLPASKGAAVRPRTCYCIWRHGFRGPKARHADRETALRELDRLNAANPDGVFDLFELRFVARKTGR